MAPGLRGLAQLGPDCEKGFTQLLTSLQAILPDLRPYSLNSISTSMVSLFTKAGGVCGRGVAFRLSLSYSMMQTDYDIHRDAETRFAQMSHTGKRKQSTSAVL